MKFTTYDVIVVGAGPAGTSCGLTIAKAGFDVLILERKTHVGVPVSCGEAIGKSKKELEMIEIPEHVIIQEIRGFRVYSPDGTPVDWISGRHEGYIVDRRIFDKELLAQAAEAGAEIALGVNVLDVIYENKKVKGVRGELLGKPFKAEAGIVIGADGVNSRIAKAVGLRKRIPPRELDTSVGYEMVNVEVDRPDLMEFYVGKEIAPRGYVWIFPKGETRANVGIGIGVGFGEQGKNALHYLQDFVEKHPIGSRKCKKAQMIEFRVGAIPLGGLNKNGIVADNIMLVGDAAGQVSPITGGGMSYGMVGGQLAGKTAAEALDHADTSGTFLLRYTEKWLDIFGETFENHLKMRKALEKATDSQLNNLASVLTGEDVLELVKGKLRKVKLATSIARKDPSLLKLLAGLLK
ncbi:MAG: geranylgeranyl reductase family protein [Candidatus Heimdallarchaeota archaeon]